MAEQGRAKACGPRGEATANILLSGWMFLSNPLLNVCIYTHHSLLLPALLGQRGKLSFSNEGCAIETHIPLAPEAK